jgi:hypothetical protein
MLNYTTDDLIRAAAVVCVTRREPDSMDISEEEFIGGNPIVRWNFTGIDFELIKKLNKRALTVEPIAYGLTLNRLRRQMVVELRRVRQNNEEK